MKHTKQQGFTLIELIVVMVILGILAATALPKFASLGSDARAAVLKGAQGSLASASAMAHGKYLVSSAPPASVVVEGATIVLVNGYPDASGAATAANLSTGSDWLVTSTTAAPNTPVIAAGQIVIIPASVSGTVAGATCYLMYTEATLSGTQVTPPVIGPPVTSGC